MLANKKVETISGASNQERREEIPGTSVEEGRVLFDKRELSSADVLDSDTGGGSGRTGRADTTD